MSVEKSLDCENEKTKNSDGKREESKRQADGGVVSGL
jgi:hypothetical protein